MNAEDIIDHNACHVCDGELYEGWRVGCDDLVFRAGAEKAVKVKEEEMKLKAIEAHWKSCPNLSKDNDQMCKHQVDCNRKCLYMNEFINQLLKIMNNNLEIAATKRYPAHVFPVAECVHLREAFEAGAKWQARQSPWISVKDRLPDNNEMVLCRMKSNNAIVSGYIMKRLGHKPEVLTAPDFHFEDLLYYEPEAWMPIPVFED